jgi:3-oxoacyl-[acyl-carrier protein] reductase
VKAESSGKVALITGASKGIGQAIAERLAAGGAAIAVHYGEDAAGAAETVRRIESAGGRARAVRANVVDAAQVKAMFEDVQGWYGRLDVVVNNAGVNVAVCALAELVEADFDRVMQTNVKGVFLVMREAAKRLGEDGRIVSIATTLSLTARPGFGVYAASKAAVEGLTRVLARELAAKRITVNAVAPGPIDTALFRKGKSEAQLAASAAFSPMNRVGKPEEVANVVAFLAGPEASWITGQVVRTNGGWI